MRRFGGDRVKNIMDRLGLPEEPIQNALSQLEKKKLITETADDPPAYLPARDLETIRLKEILDSTRTDGQNNHLEHKIYSVPEVDSIVERVDESIGSALGEETVKDIVLSHKKDI